MKRFALIVLSIVMLFGQLGYAQAVTGSWPVAGGSADRRHYSNAGLTPPLKYLWDTNMEGSVYAVPPLLSGNACYLGMAKMPAGNSWDISIQKRNLDTGDLAWQMEGGWWIWGVYGSDIIVQGYDAKLGRSWIRRINSMDKAVIWDIEWPRYTVHAAIYEDVVYSVSYTDWKEDEKKTEIDERIFFYQANSAENGRLLWRKKYSYPKTHYPPWLCVWDDGVYSAVFNTLYKLDKDSGAEKWHTDLPDKIARGTYIVATEKGVLCNSINDNLRLINREDGSVIWTKKISGYISDDEDCQSPGGTPAVMSGKIYIVARGSFKLGETKKAMCLDLATGRTIWETPIPDTSRYEHSDIGHTCTVTANAMFTMTEDASGKLTKLRAFDPSTGALLWSDVASGQPNPSELAVDSEYLVLGIETVDTHGKGIYSYVCYTNKGVPKPKIEVDNDEFDLGYINSKENITKIVKIKNSGAGELQGSLSSNVPWISFGASQFTGNNTSAVIIIKPEDMKVGENQGTIAVTSSGGKATITVKASYGGAVQPASSKESITLTCSDATSWSKDITLKGFNHGIVSVSVPWMMVSPAAFHDTDPQLRMTINAQALHNTSVFTGKVIITSNLYTKVIEVTVTGVTSELSILMQLNNKKASVNGQDITVDPPPAIIKGSTFVPLRFVGDAFGVKMDYDAKTKKISYKTSKGTLVVLQINSQKAYINGKEVKVSPPPQVIKGKTLVPVRFIGDSFEAKVNYNSQTKTISIDVAGCP